VVDGVSFHVRQVDHLGSGGIIRAEMNNMHVSVKGNDQVTDAMISVTYKVISKPETTNFDSVEPWSTYRTCSAEAQEPTRPVSNDRCWNTSKVLLPPSEPFHSTSPVGSKRNYRTVPLHRCSTGTQIEQYNVSLATNHTQVL